MLEEAILSFLSRIGQKQLATGLKLLSHKEQRRFLDELMKFGPHLLEQQRKSLSKTEDLPPLIPLDDYDMSGNKASIALGEQTNCGCIILSGGQGSRMGSHLPKALIPISLIKHKSLLQLFCEKSKAAAKKLKHPLFLAVMTSPLNDETIRFYLEKHDFFGLSSEELFIFTQELLPFLDDRGNWFLKAPGKLATGPDGNGHSLKNFVQSGIWKKWKEKRVACVNIVPIDNPLADPFDTEFIGYHTRRKNDVSLKAIFRHDPKEKVGIIGLKNKKIAVQEYFELPIQNDQFTLANIGLFCLDIDFVKKVAQFSLPWHLARKKSSVLLETSKRGCEETTLIWKFETFIFDILDYAVNSSVLVYPREEVYAPLKNSEGDKSVKTVQEALLAADKRAFFRVTGISPPEKPFELDQAFHYPTEKLIRKWFGKPLPAQNYVELD